MPKPKAWVMPEWMKPLEKHFENTGGNKVEELMNRRDPNNVVWETLAACVESQVVLLVRLHNRGLLK